MSSIVISTISQEIKSAPDYLFYEKTMPDETNADSPVKLLGGTQGAIEVVIEVGATDVTLANTKVLTFTLKYDTSPTGSFTNDIVLYTKTASGNSVIAAGTELARFAIPRGIGPYFKLNVATDDTNETGTFTAYPAYVAR